MQTIQINRDQVNIEALDAALRMALSAYVAGISRHNGVVTVHMLDSVPSALVNQARDLVLNHDPDQRTPEQIAAESAAQNQEDVRSRFAVSVLQGKSPAEITSALENQIDGWATLADAQADLKAWLPLMGAALAWLVVEDSYDG